MESTAVRARAVAAWHPNGRYTLCTTRARRSWPTQLPCGQAPCAAAGTAVTAGATPQPAAQPAWQSAAHGPPNPPSCLMDKPLTRLSSSKAPNMDRWFIALSLSVSKLRKTAEKRLEWCAPPPASTALMLAMPYSGVVVRVFYTAVKTRRRMGALAATDWMWVREGA